jgi:endo-1,4-beta-D-glucanase Y
MVVNAEERIPRVIKTAQALQLVRRAQIDFLLNWTREQAEQAALPDRLSAFEATENPDKRDWRHLYDGSVLDD